mgnify:CR=1 FL=1
MAYNAILEAEWEGEEAGLHNEQKGAFEQSFGVATSLTPTFLSAESCSMKSISGMV